VKKAVLFVNSQFVKVPTSSIKIPPPLSWAVLLKKLEFEIEPLLETKIVPSKDRLYYLQR
jgi:hypothetical protein